MFGPDTVGIARTSGPRQHRVGEIHADRAAEKAQQPRRIFEHIAGIDDALLDTVKMSHDTESSNRIDEPRAGPFC